MKSKNIPQNVRSELASIVESSDDAIISKSLDGIITSWNRGAERLYGYTSEEAVGQHISLIAPPDLPDEIPNIMEKLRRGERIEHYETVRITKAGRLVNISLTVSPVRGRDGNLIGASAIGRDITDARRAEAALRLTERLASVGRLAATITHEINNPLEAIGNVLYLLSQDHLSEKNQDLIHLAQEELNRVAQIVRQTLSFNRASTFPSEFVVKDAVEDVLEMYQPRILGHRVNVSKRYEYDGKILAHAVEIRQVLANLIRNAVEAMHPSGELLVKVSKAVSWRNLKVPGVRLLVVDNGSGISARARDQMFSPFFSTKEDQGTGLGLWVSKQIIDRHGGTIRFRSKKGIGTCFSVFLPLRPPSTRLGGNGEDVSIPLRQTMLQGA
jgi:two-component system, chemotaxis family, CheB/CheR fusion protein